MRKVIYLSVSFIFGIFLSGKAQVLSLNGKDWKIKDSPDGVAPAFCNDWIPATVPGNIQADLEAARLLEPLWYGAGDKRLYVVAKNDWYYRKEFTVPADFAGKRVRLIFDGVDNACEVWLNGKKIGGNPNMFRRFEFEVADSLKMGAVNRLDVHLERIPEVLIPYIENSDGKNSGRGTEWWFVYGLRKTIETLKDLKSPTNFGWDWGVNIWTLGIWKDVRLEASGPAIIESLKIVTPLSDDYTKADIRVDAFVDSLSKGAAELKLKISGHGPEQIFVKPISLSESSNRLQAEIALDNPALWWPNGYGEQDLYYLEATLVDYSGKISHSMKTRFGIREVRWEHTSEAPADFPEKYMPVVNGRKIRMIGSNLIPPDLLFARIPKRAPHLLRMAKALGFTTLRIWGGGVIFSPEVYDLADELGIMLELEIPMASLDPIPDPDLLKNLDRTLPNIIRQVWNHPSIIEYTGGNEMRYGRGNYPPFTESANRSEMRQDPVGNFTVIEHIRKIFAKEDPGRVFRDTDPVIGGAHSPWHSPLFKGVPEDPLGLYHVWNYIIPRVP